MLISDLERYAYSSEYYGTAMSTMARECLSLRVDRSWCNDAQYDRLTYTIECADNALARVIDSRVN